MHSFFDLDIWNDAIDFFLDIESILNLASCLLDCVINILLGGINGFVTNNTSWFLNGVLQFVTNDILSLFNGLVDQIIEISDGIINFFANLRDGFVDDFVSLLFYLVNTIVEDISNTLVIRASDFVFKLINTIGNLFNNFLAKGFQADYMKLGCQWLTYFLVLLPGKVVGLVEF